MHYDLILFNARKNPTKLLCLQKRTKASQYAVYKSTEINGLRVKGAKVESFNIKIAIFLSM